MTSCMTASGITIRNDVSINHHAASAAIPLAMLVALAPIAVLGLHVFRLESRLATLELELDTQRRLKDAVASTTPTAPAAR